MTAATTYEIGSTLAGMVTLASLEIPDPNSDFQDFAVRDLMGNGLMKGFGAPIVLWQYGYLTTDQYDALITFCTGASAEVFIATIDNDLNWARYAAVMTMPEKYQIRNGRYLDIEITLTRLVLQPEPS